MARYVVEFRTADGDVLAISIPRTEAHVVRHFQERMPYGLFVPEVTKPQRGPRVRSSWVGAIATRPWRLRGRCASVQIPLVINALMLNRALTLVQVKLVSPPEVHISCWMISLRI